MSTLHGHIGTLPDLDRTGLQHTLAAAAREAAEQRRARQHALRTILLVLFGLGLGWLLWGAS